MFSVTVAVFSAFSVVSTCPGGTEVVDAFTINGTRWTGAYHTPDCGGLHPFVHATFFK